MTRIFRTSTPRLRSSCVRYPEFSSLVLPERISFPITTIAADFAIGKNYSIKHDSPPDTCLRGLRRYFLVHGNWRIQLHNGADHCFAAGGIDLQSSTDLMKSFTHTDESKPYRNRTSCTRQG